MFFFGTVMLQVAIAILATNESPAQSKSNDTWSAKIGKRAPVSVTTPASGPLAEKYPFDPKKFGLIKGFSPGTASKADCIMIYTRTLSPPVISLATRIEAIISETPNLGSSFLHVFDKKGAQAGGYAADEVVARIAEIQTVANTNKLSQLSIGIAANPSGENVGLVDDCDLVVVFLAASDDQAKAATVAWHRSLNTMELGEDTLQSVEESLRAAIAKR